MNDVTKIAAAGAIVHGALYLAMLFVAGVLMHNGIAWKCALLGGGITFLCFAIQASVTVNRTAVLVLVTLSILVPAAGAIALLVL